MEKNKVTVYICSNEYTIVSEEDDQHILGISEHVSTLMKDLRYKNPMLNTEKAAVLTALNICDDYYKLHSQKDELAKELDEIKKREKDFAGRLDGKDEYVDRLKGQINERISQSESLKKQLDELKRQLADKELYADRLKNELREKTNQAEGLKKERQNLDTQNRALNAENEQIRQEVQELKQQLAAKDDERESGLQKRVIEYAAELEKAQKRIRELERNTKR